MDHVVQDNSTRRRYELIVNNEIVSIADYRRDGQTVVVPHVETNPAFRGQGMADRLMRGMLDDLRGLEQRITPLCPFAADYIRRHPEDQPLLS